LETALREGCEMAEKKFMQQNLDIVRDKSGSCAIACLLTDTHCYVANVGDSRAIMSLKFGDSILPLSNDHKPCDPNEQKRILQAGGKVYQSQHVNIIDTNGNKIVPPMRVLPGRLSVSRTFGDCMAKMERYGGNPNCVIAIPEIQTF